MVVSGTTVQIASVCNSDGGCAIERMNIGVTTSGTQVTSTAQCPSNCQDCGGTNGYTASGSDLFIFDARQGSTTVETYTRP
ncbi:MAG: hypothetical protein HYZ28_13795 [Myxococcales bacterium]|nr:hypothetical protein [Myxococcales bacterium]